VSVQLPKLQVIPNDQQHEVRAREHAPVPPGYAAEVEIRQQRVEEPGSEQTVMERDVHADVHDPEGQRRKELRLQLPEDERHYAHGDEAVQEMVYHEECGGHGAHGIAKIKIHGLAEYHIQHYE